MRRLKQERRGGIETWLIGGSTGMGKSKQERRGGIETKTRDHGLQPPRPRSRNAVVALKRVGRRHRQRPHGQGSRNAVVALKQAGVAEVAHLRTEEAGTPW